MSKRLNGLLAVLLSFALAAAGCGTKTQADTQGSESQTLLPTQTQDESGAGKDQTENSEEAGGSEMTEDPRLKDYIASESGLGTDTIVGCVVNGSTISNQRLMDVVYEHFNAVTFENENKPQFSFADTYVKKSRTKEYELNGQTVEMPILSFGSADKILDVLLKHNTEHPDNKIKVRGHVLVWHAQTPEWFFHEDFDESKPYVTKAVMDTRLEWYIKYVLEHFCGEDSKYKGMYYGWDVVNEACSDGKGYRKDTDNPSSSWWAVYQSEEFIVNAFRYANKYAPADVALYYNDYGECSFNKSANICALLQAVKDEEGEPGVGTRIDGFGMQAHYGNGSPGASMMEIVVKQYGQIVGKVMLTEFDWNNNGRYDGTEESRKKLFRQQGYQYKQWYDVLKEQEEKGNVDVAGITTWCVIDKFSWLQSSSDLGGGADGSSQQFPALFDDNYQPKPAFWAFVDPDNMYKDINK